MASIRIIDHTKEYKAEVERKMKMILTACGERAEGYAKDDCPVDTGNLRGSINNTIIEDGKEKAAYIGTNVEYAVYVEYDDHVGHTTGKAHFLRDSVSRHKKEYQSIAEAILKESV